MPTHSRVSIALVAVGLVLVGAGCQQVAPDTQSAVQEPALAIPSPKNAAYEIEGLSVKLSDGLARTGNGSVDVTHYFGDESYFDFDGDGKDDVGLLLVQDRGGSGLFYYAAVALARGEEYVGTNAVLLGDRIAPQSTQISDGLLLVNYADRPAGAAMTDKPSVGKTMYLTYDRTSKRLLETTAPVIQPMPVVVGDGQESVDDILTLTSKTWVWINTTYADGSTLAPREKGEFTVTFGEGGRFSATTDCNTLSGKYQPEGNTIAFSSIGMTKMHCRDSQEDVFVHLFQNAETYALVEKGELVINLKNDGGTALLR